MTTRRKSLFAALASSLLATGALAVPSAAYCESAPRVRIFDQVPTADDLRAALLFSSSGVQRQRALRSDAALADSIDRARIVMNPAFEATGVPLAPVSSGKPVAAVSVVAPAAVSAAAESAPPPVDLPQLGASPAQATSAAAEEPAHKMPAPDLAFGFRIDFAFDSANVPPASLAYLDAVGDLLRQEPGLVLFVEGHTDAHGSAAYNQDLSERRARAVGAYLAALPGVGPDQIRMRGKGEAEPLVGDPHDARNRRVQFVPAPSLPVT